MGDCIDTDAEARCSFGWLVGFQLYRGGQVKKPSLRCIPCHYDNPNPAPDVMAYNSFSRNTSFDGYGGNFSTFIHVALAAHNTHDEQSGIRPHTGSPAYTPARDALWVGHPLYRERGIQLLEPQQRRAGARGGEHQELSHLLRWYLTQHLPQPLHHRRIPRVATRVVGVGFQVVEIDATVCATDQQLHLRLVAAHKHRDRTVVQAAVRGKRRLQVGTHVRAGRTWLNMPMHLVGITSQKPSRKALHCGAVWTFSR